MSPTALLDAIAADGVSRRTVNRHREVVVATSNFGLRPERRARWELARRRPSKNSGVRRTASFADLLRIAAYTGLRRGELVALRWRDVRWTERVLVVERALSDTVERTTNGRRIRYVPLADQALAALDRLSKRPNFVSAEDYVFSNAAGDRLDPSALRRRLVAARDAAGLPPLRLHDLRHTAGTLLTRVLDPVTVKDVLGHADLKTSERYLHAIRASRLADAATRILGRTR